MLGESFVLIFAFNTFVISDTFVISWVKGAPFLLIRGLELLASLRMGAAYQENQTCGYRVGTFSPPTSREKGGAES